MSQQGAEIASTVMGTVGGIASLFPGIGTIIGGVLGLGSMISSTVGSKKKKTAPAASVTAEKAAQPEVATAPQAVAGQAPVQGQVAPQGNPLQQQGGLSLNPPGTNQLQLQLDPTITNFILSGTDKSYYG